MALMVIVLAMAACAAMIIGTCLLAIAYMERNTPLLILGAIVSILGAIILIIH